MDGVPCIRGLRIPVATVVGMIADGMSTAEVLDAYPDLEAADVQEALRYADEDRVVVSADTDLRTLLAARTEARPSVILFRHGSQHRPHDQAALLKANLPQLEQALQAGSIVVISPDRIRIRALPLPP